MTATASSVLRALSLYSGADDRESSSVARIRDFLERSPAALSRENPEGHITASAVVATPGLPAFLLVRHRKLERWLQPGGHLEPSDESVFAAALREAHEETEIESFGFPIGDRILDVDVHAIPAWGKDPAHFHHDIRHLFTVEKLPRSLPPDTGWFSLEEALAAGVDTSLERALRKAASLLPLPIDNRQSSIVNS